MPNSIRTISKNTTLAAKQATFALGDVVLCPSLSMKPFTLEVAPYGKHGLLALPHESSYYYYDAQGYSVRADDVETCDCQSSLFHNTLANRQAINTLYGNANPTQKTPLKIIDSTSTGEDEAVLLSSMTLSDTACDVEAAAVTFEDLGYLLGMIYRGEIENSTAKALARLAHDSTTTWAELLYCRLEIINEPLSQSAFGKVGA